MAAALQQHEIPDLRFRPARNHLHFVWARVPVPRFALAGLLASLVLAMVTASLVLAQTRPLWFQFAYGFQEDPQFYKVARKGYDEPVALMGMVNGTPVGAKLRIHVESISTDGVVLRIRAVSAGLEPTPQGFKFAPELTKDVSLGGISTIIYKPGQLLTIPVEGGGTLYLKGDVLDHEPQIAFGLPLEPSSTEIVLRWPVLTSGNQLIGDLRGASSVANISDSGIRFGCGQRGVFTFALRSFPGAVKAEANWGEVTFNLDGRFYRLMATAPITSGEQPRTVWVRHDPDDRESAPFLGSAPLPK